MAEATDQVDRAFQRFCQQRGDGAGVAVDRAGRAGVGFELLFGAGGDDVVLGEELGVGQGDRGAADVGVAGALGDGRRAGPGRRCGCVPPISFRESLGAKPSEEQLETWKGLVTEAVMSSGLAKGGLEPVRVEVATDRFAAGRVEREVGAGDVDADVAQVQGDAADDVGDRVRGRPSRSRPGR